ncbi:UPAR/Ly6 domain-containing protein crok [Epargyreus clarus]|uniref:UPAR/Ly6 domain-containing protein crok n=1 Tax=Epargyreus clarus TaxID=520877 RepID=UPI003C2DA27D
MILNLKHAIGVFLVLCVVHNVACIKCWNCRSNNDPKCADPFDNSTVPITDCKQEKGLPHLPGIRPTMCRKIRQKVNGEWRYFRDCAYLGEVGIQGDERFCLMRTGTYNIFIEYCTCNSKDGCNSSTLFAPMPLLILFSLASVIYKMF